MSQPRVVAIVLPELLTELARDVCVTGGAPRSPARASSRSSSRPKASLPLGVLLVDGVDPEKAIADKDRTQEATAVLAAVNEAASRFGVRAGQTVAEARVFVARLSVREVTREAVQARLGEVAEVALGFGPTVGIEALDTVWVDVTGATHLAGGEEALTLELGARVRALGHVVRVAVSSGPRLAQAFARWGRLGREGGLVVPPEDTAVRVAQLPVKALPIDAERAAWLVRLGVHTVGALAQLPRAATASRLGNDASFVLDLAEGRDTSPLVAYVPPAVPREETTWEDPVDGVEPLLFVLRGLVARLSARLEGRGEAVQVLDLVILHDRAVARLEKTAPCTSLHFELAAPLWRSEELFRVMASRLGRVELPAPTVGLRLEAHAITRALTLQLNLSRYAAGLGGSAAKGPETLPVLLAELASDLGKERVGTLHLQRSHRPERKSRLQPVSPESLARPAKPSVPLPAREERTLGRAPTRLLPRPVAFEAPFRVGATVSFEHRLYSIERIVFDHRLESIEWWTPDPVSRDYLRVWLRGAQSGLEAVVYVDRTTGARMVQAVCD